MGNTQQTLKVRFISINQRGPQEDESKRSEDVESKSVSEKNTNNAPPKNKKVYHDETEELKQEKLWHDAEKKHPWYDAPPKVKGLYHMNIEFTAGITPDGVYHLLTDPQSGPFFDVKKWRRLMENKSIKVLMEDGPRQIAKVKKSVICDLLWWSIPIPINLIVDENKKDHKTKYKKEKVMLMKVFEGDYKVEPIFADQERLCKHRLPKSREEYKKCSGGEGKIASKVTMNQYFQPYLLFNIPPVSWCIRGITIKTAKTLLEALQKTATDFRTATRNY
ncbi:unnamed protein product [Thlaspi arvense]|uniref:DUF220 domain-containing protein n=1 Tax=Thlaspi arvense TaxID=13288 RepID=A0AAU9R500_THLAR|nr:unnamed protein product [Thlaspi arvense]